LPDFGGFEKKEVAAHTVFEIEAADFTEISYAVRAICRERFQDSISFARDCCI
jgi:hypothetical protein